MKKNNDDGAARRRKVLHRQRVIGAVVMGAMATTAFAKVEFHANGLVGVTWTDNIGLNSDGDPNKESAYGFQVNPGFSLVQKSQRYGASLYYSMQNTFYPENHDRNSTYHQASADANAELISDYLFLLASGSYSQQIIDPSLPANSGNFFVTGNQADALHAQITPELRHDFGAVHLDARYTRGFVDYKSHDGDAVVGALQDADTESRSVSLSNVDEDAVFSWGAEYESQIARYDLAPDFRFDRANVYVGLLLGRGLRLIGRGGKESDPSIDASKGGLDETTWEAGFQWDSGKRTHIEGFYGERFYGSSYSARIEHTARFATLELKYEESPLTQAQEMNARPAGLNPVEIGAVAPGSDYFSRLTADVFLRKSFDAILHLTGKRTQVDISASDYRREYLRVASTTATGGEHTRSFAVAFTRKLSERAGFELGGSVDNTELRDGEEFHDVNFDAEIYRKLTRHVQISLGGFHIRRQGDVQYEANGASLNLSGEF